MDVSEYLCDTILDDCKRNKKTELMLDDCNISKIPTEIKNFNFVKKLILSNNLIETVNGEDLPANLETLILINNPIWNIDFINFPKSIKELQISECRINSLTNLNKLVNLEVLYCSNNEIDEFPELPNNLIRLIANSCGINSFEGTFPSSIETISLDDNQLIEIPVLPDNVVSLCISQNELTSIDNLPKNLERLHLGTNSITEIKCEFPSSLEELYLQHNELDTLPKLPNNLIKCDISYNNLERIEFIPNSLTEIDISNNDFKYLPKELYENNINVISTENNYNDIFDEINDNLYRSSSEDDNDMMSLYLYDENDNIISSEDTKRNNENITPFSGMGYRMSHNNSFNNMTRKVSPLDNEINNNKNNPYYIIPQKFMRI